MHILGWYLVAMQLVGFGASIMAIGQPRKPLSGGVILGSLALSTAPLLVYVIHYL